MDVVMLEPLESRTLFAANGSIAGHAFLDADYNGHRNGSDQLARGQMVYLDTNGNGRLDKSEPSRRTNSRGGYVFSGLDPGTYRVRLVLDDNTVATRVARGWTVQLAKDQAVTARDFAFAPAMSVSGTVTFPWHAGIKGFTVFLDTNSNGRLDSGEASAVTDGTGTFHIPVAAPGDYTVTLAPKNAFTPTNPVRGSQSVSVTAGATPPNLAFVVDGPILDPR